MPNWVTSALTIEGPAESLAALREQLRRPYTSPFDADKTITGEFLLWNIIRPADVDGAYSNQPATSKRDPFEDGDAWRKEIQGFLRDGMDWYNWNLRNWGTKWEIGGAVVLREDTNELVFTFATAWSPPVEALDVLSAQFPMLEMHMLFHDEMDNFAGEVQYSEGSLVMDNDVHIDHHLMVTLYGDCWVCADATDPEIVDSYRCREYAELSKIVIPDTIEGLV